MSLLTPPTVDRETYRRVFREYAGDVIVVTLDGSDGPHGFTATSLTSVSAEPPIISFVINERSSSWPALSEAPVGRRQPARRGAHRHRPDVRHARRRPVRRGHPLAPAGHGRARPHARADRAAGRDHPPHPGRRAVRGARPGQRGARRRDPRAAPVLGRRLPPDRVMSRRAIALALAVVALASACSSAAATTDPEAPVTIRYQGSAGQVTLPELADDLGYFEDVDARVGRRHHQRPAGHPVRRDRADRLRRRVQRRDRQAASPRARRSPR